MKLYLVYRTDRVDYDEHDSFVVAANSEENALDFSPYGDNDYSTWTKYKKNLKIEYIGESNSSVEKVILALSMLVNFPDLSYNRQIAQINNTTESTEHYG